MAKKILTMCFYLLQNFYYYIYCKILFRTLSIVTLYLSLIPLLFISAFHPEQWNLNSVYLLLKSLISKCGYVSVCLWWLGDIRPQEKCHTILCFLHSGIFRPIPWPFFSLVFPFLSWKICVVLHIRNLLFLNLILSYYHCSLVSLFWSSVQVTCPCFSSPSTRSFFQSIPVVMLLSGLSFLLRVGPLCSVFQWYWQILR